MSADASQLTDFDFHQCQRCRRIITKPEMLTIPANGSPCPCGGVRFSPINLPWWGWLIPRVLAFAWQRIRGRV